LITNFSDIYTAIEQSKNRVQNVRERLRECKNLLLLKRQDIRKLWLLTSEQNALVKIYQNIDELKHVPQRLQFYLNKHLFIHASLLLIKAKEHQELRLINALSDIDIQLKEERSALENQLRSELINQLFEKPCRDILGNKNVSSSSTTTINSMNKNDHNYLSRIRENRLLRKQLDQDFESGKLVFESHSIAIIPDKYILVDIRHQAPDLYLDVLLQSLAILSRLNETLDYLQKQLHEQFYRIVLRTTQHIVDNNFVLHSNNSHQNFLTNNPDCLRDLLETCYEQFKIVVKNIEYLLNILKLIQEHQAPLQIQQQQYIGIQTAERQRGWIFLFRKNLNEILFSSDIKSEQKQTMPTAIQFEIPYLFSMELVWETLQKVLSEVLNEYIEYNNTIDGLSSNSLSNSNSTDYTNHHSVVDFSPYLTKKAPPRSQQIPRLFEFSQSAQFNSMTTYLQEQNRFAIKQETTTTATAYKQYVCKPNYRNITAVHDILQRIIEDIDTNIKLHPTKRILDRLDFIIVIFIL
jgi:exocyst complex component 4